MQDWTEMSLILHTVVVWNNLVSFMHKESVEVYQWASSNMQDWTEMSEMSSILQTTNMQSVQLSCSVK